MEAEIARLTRAADCAIHEDNWESVMFFLECGTQWRVAAGLGGLVWLGLDYAGVAALMHMRRVPPARRGALLADLQIMELAALAALNARPPAAPATAER